ncbi:unnamed protein product [Blepharisma stoltei]|uniref:Uncharacterized protein n=1 Tax=Blepharisma stoltei TaxID=1481888 RepID=A0AAU9IIS0_9CILI|nr:unnamed protein product [Blepharisma stoltei]
MRWRYDVDNNGFIYKCDSINPYHNHKRISEDDKRYISECQAIPYQCKVDAEELFKKMYPTKVIYEILESKHGKLFFFQ